MERFHCDSRKSYSEKSSFWKLPRTHRTQYFLFFWRRCLELIPNRSKFHVLTFARAGLYAHNHRVLTNTLLCGSDDWKTNYESRSFAKYLSDDDYDTGECPLFAIAIGPGWELLGC